MGPGHGPQPTAAPTATRLATPNADQCVHQLREGSGRNRQTPPKKKTRKGGNPPQPRTRAHQRKKKGGGGERQSRNREAANLLHKRQATPPARQHQRRNPRGPPKEHRRTTMPNPATPSQKQRPTMTRQRPKGRGKGHPGHASAHPNREVAGHRQEKKTDATQTKEEGGTETKGPKTGTGSGKHYRAKTRPRTTHPNPPTGQPEKKKKGGGETTHTATPAQPHATGSPTKGWLETDGARPRGHTPKNPTRKVGWRKRQAPRTAARNGGARPKPVSKHTRPRPQPRVAGLLRNPTSNACTTNPGQKWRGKAETRAETHAP